MNVFGVQQDISYSAKMALCANELKRIREGALKGMSFEASEGFKCIQAYKGNKKNIGIYATVEACNAAYDNFEIYREIHNQKIRLKRKGFNKSRGADNRFVVRYDDGTHKSFADANVAAMSYAQMIEANIIELKKKLKPIDPKDIVKPSAFDYENM